MFIVTSTEDGRRTGHRKIVGLPALAGRKGRKELAEQGMQLSVIAGLQSSVELVDQAKNIG
jgi:hypothetical protein